MKPILLSTILIVIGLSAFSQSPSRSICLRPAYPLVIGETSIDGLSYDNNGLYMYDILQDSLPQYEIGNIFAQTVRYSEDGMGFYVKADSLHSFNVEYSYEIDVPPVGSIEFNPKTGRFKYYPSKEDHNPFTIVFIATNGTETISEEVKFDLLSLTAPEENVIQSIGVMPASTDYTLMMKETSKKKMFLNNLERTAYSYSISGKEIVFDNNLQNKVCGLSGRNDLYELNIYVERLVVRSALRFPQTDVTIYAKELVFEDHDTVLASINTTPMAIDSLVTDTVTNAKGINGGHAGNIAIFAKTFKANMAKRLIMNGARGQCTNRKGLPGNGGNGGTLTSNLDLSDYCDYARGSSGVRYDVAPDSSHVAGAVIGSGTMGTDGHFERTDNPYAYLHPYYISRVIHHANDAFINNYPDLAMAICHEYESQINEYMESEFWEKYDVESDLALRDRLMEIGDMLYKLEQGLDYFGNPQGWVPLLSFEVLLENFDNEIDRAIPTLYLYYWLTRVDRTLEQWVDACTLAAKIKEQNLQDGMSQLNDLIFTIPILDDRLEEIKLMIKDVEERIKILEQDLLEKAKKNVKKRNRIKKAMSIGRAVVNVLPVLGPIGATVGTGLNAALSYSSKLGLVSSDDYSAAVKDFSKEVCDTSFYSKLTKSLQNIKDANGSVKDILGELSSLGKVVSPLISNVSSLSSVLSQSSTPTDQVTAEWQLLCAESPEMKKLNGQLNNLKIKKQDFVNQLAKTVTGMSKTITTINNDALALDGLRRDVFIGNSKRDLNAMLYLDDMEQRARSRLLKYHYYLRKAYEYRLLKPYQGEANLINMFERFEKIAIAGDSVTNEADYKDLGGIFWDVVSKMAEEIIDKYNVNYPEQSAPITIILPKEQLDIINSGDNFVLNFHKMGIFAPDEEDVGIVDLGIQHIETHVEGNVGYSGYMDLNMTHQGVSQFRKDGQIYWFDHMSRSTTSPHTWGIRYDAVSKESSTIQPSAASASLLASILKNSGNIMLFSRPSAWGDITLAKKVHTSGGADIVIDSLVLRLQYDFTRRPNKLRNIDITTNDELLPFIACSEADVSGKTDGNGNLYRSYSMSSQQVKFTAIEQYGTYQFKNWTDRRGRVVSEKNDLTVNRATDQFYRANYERRVPILNVPDTIKVGYGGGFSTVNVRNNGLGDIEMDWYVSDSLSSWVHLNGNTEGIDDGTFSFEFDANESGVNRLDSLEIFAPETDIMSKMIYIAQVDDYDGMELVNKQDDSIKIYPNPAHDYICVEGSEISAVNIYTLAGIEITDYKFANDNNATIDISNLPYGMYIMTIKTSKGQTSKKVMKTY